MKVVLQNINISIKLKQGSDFLKHAYNRYDSQCAIIINVRKWYLSYDTFDIDKISDASQCNYVIIINIKIIIMVQN